MVLGSRPAFMFGPDTDTDPVALIVTVPADPAEKSLLLILAPPVRVNVPTFTVTAPAVPFPFVKAVMAEASLNYKLLADTVTSPACPPVPAAAAS